MVIDSEFKGVICMTNKEKILNELSNDVKKLAELLITCKDITGWDEIPTYEYVTSDETAFSENEYDEYAYEEAVNHEIEWLNVNT